MRKTSEVTAEGGVLRGQSAVLYIGSSFELEGTPGEPATKITKHIFMGSTRVCSIETAYEIGGEETSTWTSTSTSTSTSTDTSTDTDTSSSTTVTASHVYYYHQDHLGSSNVITNETGSIVNILEYSPYGELSRNTGNYSTDKRFTGKIYDDSSALCYYGARYYDPELGRFISADPTIQHPYDPQDFNRYSYCRNNPVKYIDPNGLGWWSDFWNWIGDNWQGIVAVAMIVVSVVVLIVAPYTAPYMFPTLLGQISGAIIGGASAAASGGNIGSGMLFGVVAGTVTGGSLGGMAKVGYGGFVAGEMAMGAVSGAGTGATAGYAGGQGDIQDIIKGAAIGAGTAAIITGAMGMLQGHPLLPSSGGTTPAGVASSVSEESSNKTPSGNEASKSSPGTTAFGKKGSSLNF